MAEGFAPADQAVLGLDPHEQDLEMVPRLAGEARLGSAHLEGQSDDHALDGSDFHFVPRLATLEADGLAGKISVGRAR
jgi:hypothetical protein